MPRLLRHHSTVVSYLALFLALGGSAAYAQSRWQYTGADIADESLTGDDIQYASLGKNDLGPNSVGPSELNVKIETVTVTSSVYVDGVKTAVANCPAGYRVIGGGGEVDGSGDISGLNLTSSRPYGDDAWKVEASAITFPATKTNLYHSHKGDSVYDVVWKDWIVVDNHRYTGPWTVTASAICTEV